MIDRKGRIPVGERSGIGHARVFRGPARVQGRSRQLHRSEQLKIRGLLNHAMIRPDHEITKPDPGTDVGLQVFHSPGIKDDTAFPEGPGGRPLAHIQRACGLAPLRQQPGACRGDQRIGDLGSPHLDRISQIGKNLLTLIGRAGSGFAGCGHQPRVQQEITTLERDIASGGIYSQKRPYVLQLPSGAQGASGLASSSGADNDSIHLSWAIESLLQPLERDEHVAGSLLLQPQIEERRPAIRLDLQHRDLEPLDSVLSSAEGMLPGDITVKLEADQQLISGFRIQFGGQGGVDSRLPQAEAPGSSRSGDLLEPAIDADDVDP